MSIGQRIAKLREDAGISQRDLAQMVGVSCSMIAQIERGTKTVSLQLGKVIAKVMDVDIMEIIGREA